MTKRRVDNTCPNCTGTLELHQEFKQLRVTYAKYTKASMWHRAGVDRLGQVKYKVVCPKCSYTNELTEGDVRDDILWEHQRNYQ